MSWTGCHWKQMELFDGYSYGFCPDKKAWDKFWKAVDTGKMDIPVYPSSEGRTTFLDPRGFNVIHEVALVTMGDETDKDPIQVASLLVHEAVHIKQAILSCFGERNVGDETEAYMVQRIAQDLMYMYVNTRVKK